MAGNSTLYNQFVDFSATPAALLRSGEQTPDGTVDRIDVPIVAAIEVSVGGWRIVFDAAVKRVMRTYRSRRLPNDTGGVLLGAFDLVRKSVFISDVLSSPDGLRLAV